MRLLSLLVLLFGLSCCPAHEADWKSGALMDISRMRRLSTGNSVALTVHPRLRNIMLVATLDGTIYALNRQTGVFLWVLDKLGGPLLQESVQSGQNPAENDNSDGASVYDKRRPVYIVEPLKSGGIYAYMSDQPIQRLPISVRHLIETAPVRWLDGTLYLGRKSTTFFAIDADDGALLHAFRIDTAGGQCPSPDIYAQRNVVFLGRTDYHLTALRADSSKAVWNVTYSEYTGGLGPDLFPETSHFPTPKIQGRDDGLPLLHSSFNGFIYARDRISKVVLWIHKLPSAATLFLRLEDGIEGGYGVAGIDIEPANLPRTGNEPEDLQHDLQGAQREIVNIGRRKDGTLFALPQSRFPRFKDASYKEIKTNGHFLVSPQDHEGNGGGKELNGTENNNYQLVPIKPVLGKKQGGHSCVLGAPEFPECLLGSRIAYRIMHVPLIEAPDSSKGGALNKKSQPWSWANQSTYGLATLLIASIFAYLIFRRWPPKAPHVPTTTGSTISDDRFQDFTISPSDLLLADTEGSDGDPNASRRLKVSNEVLGYGSHGTVVFRGLFDGREVAVKRMLLDFYDIARQEVALLQHSDHHPNVIRYFCREQSDRFVYIALELCKASLADIIDQTNDVADHVPKRLDDARLLLENSGGNKAIISQMMQGLDHLHQLNMVHRDIKPANILVSPQGRILLTDFGLSKRLTEGQTSFHATVQSGTAGWRAPECLISDEAAKLRESIIEPSDTRVKITGQEEHYRGIKITKSIDIFAAGCVCFYILTDGKHPFGSRLERDSNIVNGRYSLEPLSLVDVEAADLIESMISRDSKKRPTASQVLDHPYFWNASRRLALLQDLSDRLENEPRNGALVLALEHRRSSVLGGANHLNEGWHLRVDRLMWTDLGRYRRYQPHSFQDLLRAIRNKRHHFLELPEELRKRMGDGTAEGFSNYFESRFPGLIREAWKMVFESGLAREMPFKEQYFAEWNMSELPEGLFPDKGLDSNGRWDAIKAEQRIYRLEQVEAEQSSATHKSPSDQKTANTPPPGLEHLALDPSNTNNFEEVDDFDLPSKRLLD